MHYIMAVEGDCIIYHLDHCKSEDCDVTKLSGPEYDRVTAVVKHGQSLWTAGRDGCIRMYNFE